MKPILKLLLCLLMAGAHTVSAQLIDTQLAFEFNAGSDPQGDNLWEEATQGNQSLTFGSPPVRANLNISSSSYPALATAYETPATGLSAYFESGSPVRSATDATFELWIEVTNLSAGADQVIYEAGGAGRGFSFTLSDATLSFNVDGDLSQDVTLSQSLSLGMHHIVGTITNTNDGAANDAIALYVDGILAQSATNVRLDDWAGGNLAGVGMVGGTVTGVTNATAFHGKVSVVRYYHDHVMPIAAISHNNNYFRERITTYVTGKSRSDNFSVTSSSDSRPTRTAVINNILYGFQHVRSDGTDGLFERQFIRWDLCSSNDGGITWNFIKTMIDNTHPELTDSLFASVQLRVTAAGHVALWAKHHGSAGRKFLSCVFSETPEGNYALTFNELPYGEPSGDLGSVTSGGNYHLVSANTTFGFINIFQVNTRGDDLANFTLNQQWFLPDGHVDHREAPSIFSQDGYWILTTSGRTGWRPNQHKYAYATDLAGPWSAMMEFGDSTGYHSQLFFNARSGSSRMFSSTRNAPQWGGEGGSRPVWLPLSFNRVPDRIAVNYYDEVVLNTTADTVEGFHYDRGRELDVTAANLVGFPDDISAVIDGDESTSWTNALDANKRTIDLNLNGSKLVKALKFRPHDEWRYTYKVKIYIGDGTNFTQVFPQADEPPIIPNYAFMGPVDVTPTSGSVVRIENYETYNNGNMNNNFGLFELQVWGETGNPGLELNETFDTSLTGWTINAGAGTSATLATVPGDSSTSLKLTDIQTSTRVQASRTISAQNGSQVVVEWKHRTDNASAGEYIRFSQGSTVAVDLASSMSIAASSGHTTIAQSDNTWTHDSISEVTIGAWHVFRLEINTDTDTFDLYIDGQLAWQGGKLRNPVTAIDRVMVGTSGNAINVSAYFDNITVDGPNP